MERPAHQLPMPIQSTVSSHSSNSVLRFPDARGVIPFHPWLRPEPHQLRRRVTAEERGDFLTREPAAHVGASIHQFPTGAAPRRFGGFRFPRKDFLGEGGERSRSRVMVHTPFLGRTALT
jgi:hypothetical protein